MTSATAAVALSSPVADSLPSSPVAAAEAASLAVAAEVAFSFDVAVVPAASLVASGCAADEVPELAPVSAPSA